MVKTVTEASIIGPLPTGAQSKTVILVPYAVDLLPLYGYEQTEFLVEGTSQGHPYCTRLLVRHPREMKRFNGRALMEVSHIWGGTSAWRAYHRELMRKGYIWFELDSQAPSALDLIKGADPVRYERMTFLPGELARDFAASIPFTENPTPEVLAAEYDRFKERWWRATPQSFDIIAQVAAAVRHGLPGIQRSAVKTLAFAGISQTGGVVRRFITDYHNSARLPGGSGVFDLYLPGASGGAALPDIDAKVIEILGEAEFQSVRWPCGVSGQTRGLAHRREDSDSFRLYEIAGMAHRETRRMSEKDKIRLKDCPLPDGAKWSTFPNTHLYNAILDLGFRWVERGCPPPPSQFLKTVGGTDEICRDDHGNALGGLRTPMTDVPISTFVAATPTGRPSWYHGNETPFSAEKLLNLYGDKNSYREAFGDSLLVLLEQGFLLPEDAEELRLEAAELSF